MKETYDMLIIGGSAGSLSMVLNIIPHLRESMNVAVILVFHRKTSDDSPLVHLLTQRTSFIVKEAEDKDEIMPNVIYIAPPDYHLLVEKNRTLSLDDSEKVNFSRPSIDVTFETAADVYGRNLMCVLLSGANADGVAGLVKAKKSGALIIVQDPDSAEVAFMPQQAKDNVAVDLLLKKENIKDMLNKLSNRIGVK